MKITAGMIVFNAASTLPEGMFKQQLDQLYFLADQIVIVEGATRSEKHYWDGDTSWATQDGHSTDNTVDIIKNYPDPDNKIVLIQKEDAFPDSQDGFWDGKTSMCNQWSKHATGDYLWQIDSDEFYTKEDIAKIKELLKKDAPTQVDFYAFHFFGGMDRCITPTTSVTWGNNIPWCRIFKHEAGAKWLSHEPPVYLNAKGERTDSIKRIDRLTTLNLGIVMRHYSYVCEAQILFKSRFFRNDSYLKEWSKIQNAPNRIEQVMGPNLSIPFTHPHSEFVTQ